jgi:predicted TIM-barrel fold metal-dependent hydrolase
MGKIDIYAHILPPKYKERLPKKAPSSFYSEANDDCPALSDLDIRFRAMDRYGLVQVLTLGAPPVEYMADGKDAAELSTLANDEMAELVLKHPDRFLAAVACLPMNNVDAALREADRAVVDLNFKGVQIYTPVNGKPLDQPEFLALYQKMADYDLPIWIHPARDSDIPDYQGESGSKYRLFTSFGWPYETTLAMARLVFSGVLERYPKIKFITHHCGGMIPHFEQRIAVRKMYGSEDRSTRPEHVERLSGTPLDYFRKFYTDTAISGSTPALMCAHAFFGADHLLFGADYPYGAENGEVKLRQTIHGINSMDVPESDKEKIFEKNSNRLLHLSD